MSVAVLRSYVLGLASHTSWSLSEIRQLKISDLLWWCEGLPKEEG